MTRLPWVSRYVVSCQGHTVQAVCGMTSMWVFRRLATQQKSVLGDATRTFSLFLAFSAIYASKYDLDLGVFWYPFCNHNNHS